MAKDTGTGTNKKPSAKNAAGEQIETNNSIMQSLTIGLAAIRLNDKGSSVIFINDCLLDMLGHKRVNFIPDNFIFALLGQDYNDRNEILHALLNDKDPIEFITQLIHSSGEKFVAHILVKPRTKKDDIYDVVVINLDGYKFFASKPQDENLPVGNGTVIDEYLRRWHDRRYRTILEDKSVITFNYNCETDMFTEYFSEGKRISCLEHPHYIKSSKYNRRAAEPEKTIIENFEIMTQAPMLREFDMHDDKSSQGYRLYHCKCKSIAAKNGRVKRIVGRFDDFTCNQSEQTKLHDMAKKDGLTGALNRAAMERFFDDYFEKPVEERAGMFFFLDFDKFKVINDTYGHIVGDEVLKASVKAISKILRPGDLFCRYGGDEFLIFIDDMTDVDAAKKKASQIIRAVASVEVNGTIRANCSLGFTSLWSDDKKANEAIRRADAALLQAKKFSIRSYVYYGRDGISNAVVARRLAD